MARQEQRSTDPTVPIAHAFHDGTAVPEAEGETEEVTTGAAVGRLSPYLTQQEYIDEQLAAIRLRIRAAGGHGASRMAALDEQRVPTAWPSHLLALEDQIEVRVLGSSADVLPIMRLRDRFALTQTEERVLWVLIAHQLCPSARRMLRELSSEQLPDPTTDVLRRIVCGGAYRGGLWRELDPEGTLQRFGFIERIDPQVDVPLYRQQWKAGSRVLALLHGVVGVDPMLAGIVSLEWSAARMEDLELGGDAASRIRAAFDGHELVVVHGRPGSGRRSALVAAARAHGQDVLRIDGHRLAKDRDRARRQLRAVSRECHLLGLVPLIRDLDALAPGPDSQDRIELVEEELPGLVLATSVRPIARRWQRTPIVIELPALTGAQRASLWKRALPSAEPAQAADLANLYPLAPALVEAAGRLATTYGEGGRVESSHIEHALRAVLDDRLAGLATRVPVRQTWDDLVLPDEQRTAVMELLARIRERTRVYEDWGFADKVGRGLGVSALFSGPPGTGKTMTAGLIARSLRTEVYQVDLSKITSKWIGETEKNLAALFDAAEAGHAILLFDEADALFAKRTEVKSSNDRHANQEVNFLLQRIESYGGICILTTNHATSLDEAFLRRLSVHVRFPMPEAEERERLWRALIPARAPTAGDLRLDELAETYVMSGGYIKNAVLRAAFLAADEGGPIDAQRLARAAQLEYEALGKIVSARTHTRTL